MDTSIRENTILINEPEWNDFERIIKPLHIMYDGTISKLYKGYTEVEFYSKNDYSKVKTQLNKHNIPYKDRFNESIRKLIRKYIKEYHSTR